MSVEAPSFHILVHVLRGLHGLLLTKIARTKHVLLLPEGLQPQTVEGTYNQCVLFRILKPTTPNIFEILHCFWYGLNRLKVLCRYFASSNYD